MAAKTFDEWWDSFPRERYTFSYECAREGWNTAIKLVVENGNSLQQLKAEIFRLRKQAVGPASQAYINGWNACLDKVCEKLSAV